MATIKLKRSEALQLSGAIQILNQTSQDKVFPAKFNYALSKNLRKLKDEVKSSLEADKKTMEEFEKRRIEILELHAVKDKNGKPKKDKNKYTLTNEAETLAEDAIKELKMEFKSAIDESEEFMNEEISVEVHQVPVSTVPDIPSIIFDGIFEMIIGDPTPEPKK